MHQFPEVTDGMSDEALDQAAKRAAAYLESIYAQRVRREGLSDAQRLAEQLNFLYSREPSEAWYYEAHDWSKPEHARWLRKAKTLLEKVSDPQEALALARLLRS